MWEMVKNTTKALIEVPDDFDMETLDDQYNDPDSKLNELIQLATFHIEETDYEDTGLINIREKKA